MNKFGLAGNFHKQKSLLINTSLNYLYAPLRYTLDTTY
jgi:hypothetical protein